MMAKTDWAFMKMTKNALSTVRSAGSSLLNPCSK
jgi:hypothetical protein